MSQDQLQAVLFARIDGYFGSSPRHKTLEETRDAAKRVWSIYCRLSVDSKHTFPIFRFKQVMDIIASRDSSILLSSQVHRKNKRFVKLETAKRWGRRIATIITDMQSAGATDIDECGAFDIAMERSAACGDIRQVEEIAREVERVPGYRNGKRVLIHRLTALSQRLRDQASTPRRKGQWALEPDEEGTEVLWALLRKYREGSSQIHSLDPFSVRLIVVCTNLLRARSVDSETASQLDGILEQMFREVYMLNINDFSIRADAPAYFHFDALNALLGYLGRKGELWRMVSAFETLTNPKEEETDLPALEDLGSDVPASLRSQISQVPSYILSSFRGLDWKALRMTSGPEPPSSNIVEKTEPQAISRSPYRSYNHYFPSPPMPFEIAATLPSLPRTAEAQSSSSNSVKEVHRQDVPRGRTDPVIVNNLMYQTMLRHAADLGDVDVAMYCLRSLHTAAAEAQTEWIRSVFAAQRTSPETFPAASGEAVQVDPSNLGGEQNSNGKAQGDPTGEPLLHSSWTGANVPTDEKLSQHTMQLDSVADEIEEEDRQTYDDMKALPESTEVEMSDLNDLIQTLNPGQTSLERYDSIRRPRIHMSFWAFDLVHWQLRLKHVNGAQQSHRLSAIQTMMEDTLERLRQERLMLFGEDESSSTGLNGVGARPLPETLCSAEPPFAGYESRRRRLDDLSLRQAFDPGEYLYSIESSRDRLAALYMESCRQRERHVARKARALQSRLERRGQAQSVSSLQAPALAVDEPMGESAAAGEWEWQGGIIVRR